MLQDTSEAARSSSITIFTGRLALITRLRMDMSVVMIGVPRGL
jgi:hypothetical protein